MNAYRYVFGSALLLACALMPTTAGGSAAAAGCIGVQIKPGTSIPLTVAAQPDHTTFCIAAGTYRVGRTIEPKAGDTLVGAPGTVIDGSRVVTGWRRSGTAWVVGGRTQGPIQNMGGWGDAPMVNPQAKYSDDVFIDGRILWKAGVKIGGRVIGRTASTVRPGEYFVDYDANTIRLGSNPVGHVVSQAYTQAGVASNADDVTISGLTVQRMAGDGIDARGDNWTISGNLVRQNHVIGIDVGQGTSVLGNTVLNNGQYGIAGNAVNALVQDNVVAYNDAARFATPTGCSGAGGSKFVNALNLTVRSNNYHHNYCNGIWIDIASKDVLIENNTSSSNVADGIREEVSYDVTVRGNTVRTNGRNGIAILDSPGTEIDGNTVAGNRGGQITLQQHHRVDPVSPYGLHELRDANVHDNEVWITGDQVVGARNTDKPSQSAIFESWNNRFWHNTYHVATQASRQFIWMGERTAFAGWQAHGLDTDGQLITG